MNKAVYAGSFDPITNGHMWIIERVREVFDHLVVAIGNNPSKTYTFNQNQRLQMLYDATKHIQNIEVVYFENEFLVNYAKSIGAQYIIRGIRNAADYEYEKSMRYVNSDVSSDITTYFLIPPRQYAEVSSGLVRGLIGTNGWESLVVNYLPSCTFEKIIKWHNSLKTTL